MRGEEEDEKESSGERGGDKKRGMKETAAHKHRRARICEGVRK